MHLAAAYRPIHGFRKRPPFSILEKKASRYLLSAAQQAVPSPLVRVLFPISSWFPLLLLARAWIGHLARQRKTNRIGSDPSSPAALAGSGPPPGLPDVKPPLRLSLPRHAGRQQGKGSRSLAMQSAVPLLRPNVAGFFCSLPCNSGAVC